MMIYLILSVPKLISFRYIGCEMKFNSYVYWVSTQPQTLPVLSQIDGDWGQWYPSISWHQNTVPGTANINQGVCKTYNTDLLYCYHTCLGNSYTRSLLILNADEKSHRNCHILKESSDKSNQHVSDSFFINNEIESITLLVVCKCAERWNPPFKY